MENQSKCELLPTLKWKPRKTARIPCYFLQTYCIPRFHANVWCDFNAYRGPGSGDKYHPTPPPQRQYRGSEHHVQCNGCHAGHFRRKFSRKQRRCRRYHIWWWGGEKQSVDHWSAHLWRYVKTTSTAGITTTSLQHLCWFEAVSMSSLKFKWKQIVVV